jgi:hypothetical protein
VKRVSVRPLGDTEDDRRYAAIVVALGFESRSSHVGLRLASQAQRRFAAGFTSRRVLAHATNAHKLKSAGFEIAEVGDRDFASWFRDVLGTLTGNEGRCNLAVDVSSFSRLRLAQIVEALFLGQLDVTVDFLYATAVFAGPQPESSLIEICGPVIPDFAGWSPHPEQPVTAFIGLGYEPERAIGAIEYLEPGSVWVFCPQSSDKRYDDAVRIANEPVFEMVPSDRVVRYPVSRPAEQFIQLESLLYAELAESRPVLVPFGPKVFALSCLLAACMHYPHTAVWRVSEGDSGEPLDRVASGEISGLTATFADPIPYRDESA